jgi:RimJ/RimL family protein N-acetyltransferase
VRGVCAHRLGGAARVSGRRRGVAGTVRGRLGPISTAPVEHVALRGGERIAIRPIRPGDKALLRAGFDRLGPESRYRRFLAPTKALHDKELAYFTEVDHVDHEALIALSPDGDLVGVVRYIRLQDRPEAAEFALTVVDDWQGRGVATELLRRLVPRARAAGIELCHTTCLAANAKVIELLEELGPVVTRRLQSGVLELDVGLPERLEPDGPLHRTLHHAAAGALEVRSPRAPDGRPSARGGPRTSA